MTMACVPSSVYIALDNRGFYTISSPSVSTPRVKLFKAPSDRLRPQRSNRIKPLPQLSRAVSILFRFHEAADI